MSFTASLPPTDASTVVARRNASLAPRQRWTVYGALAAGSLAMAFGFAAGGVWPVLPYSLLELLGLAAAFLWIERRAADCDRLTLDGDRVLVEHERAGHATRRELSRHWLRVEVDEEGFAHEPRLVLRSGRDAVRFGDALPAAERVALARTIRGMLAAVR
ncbi:MAG: DUF2244 domain-containing protein [Betaproteobacteria bacterium]